jgi:hypothetical protein
METYSDGGTGQPGGTRCQEADHRTIKIIATKKQNASGDKYRP